MAHAFSTRIARTIATLPPIRLAGPWLTNEQARSEQPFALLLEHGLVNGVIDHIVRRPDGLWQIVDYKIGPIPEKAKAAERHRLQLKIYGLYLAKLFQDQGTYPTVLYFTDLDNIHSVNFTPTEQVVTLERVDDLVAQLILTKPHP